MLLGEVGRTDGWAFGSVQTGPMNLLIQDETRRRQERQTSSSSISSSAVAALLGHRFVPVCG